MQKKHPFTSAEGSRCTVLYCSVFCILTLLILSIIWLRLWLTIASGHHDQATGIRDIARVMLVLGFGFIAFALVSLVQYVALAMWMYAMNSNLPALQYQPKMTPLVAALVLFVPFLNFLLSPYALLEIWWGSDPGQLPQSQTSRSPPSSVWLWSLLLPLTSVLGSVAGQTLPTPQRIDAFPGLAIWGLVYFFFAILSNLLLMLMLRNITRMQEARYEQLYLSKPDADAVADITTSYPPPSPGEPMRPF